MRIPAAIVDLLPFRLRKPGNLRFLGDHMLHFFVGNKGPRTIEWDCREIGVGRRAFPFGHWDDAAEPAIGPLPAAGPVDRGVRRVSARY